MAPPRRASDFARMERLQRAKVLWPTGASYASLIISPNDGPCFGALAADAQERAGGTIPHAARLGRTRSSTDPRWWAVGHRGPPGLRSVALRTRVQCARSRHALPNRAGPALRGRPVLSRGRAPRPRNAGRASSQVLARLIKRDRTTPIIAL